MAPRFFPDPSNPKNFYPQDPYGAIILGWPLPDPSHPDYTAHAQTLLTDAYRHGIFPWPLSAEEGEPDTVPWCCPPKRAILKASELNVPRSLKVSYTKARKNGLRLTLNAAFGEVLKRCAETPRAGQSGTWITPLIRPAYEALNRAGLAHSVEAWMGDELVGGLYGVCVDGVFAGESMFHRVNDASKWLVMTLVQTLDRRGLSWIDIQQQSPHLARLGAEEIKRAEYLDLLTKTQSQWRARGSVSRFWAEDWT